MEVNFAFARFCTRRNNGNTGRIGAFVLKNEPFRPHPNSFGRSRSPNPHRNRKTRNPRNWIGAFL